MNELADIFLGAGAFGAAFYCFVLSRRLRRFNDLERGVGGAVALLSAQVDDLTKALSSAQEAAHVTRSKLTDQIARAEQVTKRLELLVASVHDVQREEQVKPTKPMNPSRFVRHAVSETSDR